MLAIDVSESPYALELLCFVSEYLGVHSEHFKTLFEQRPWLMGVHQPDFQCVMNLERKSQPEKASTFYTKKTYQKMVTQLGISLIKSQEFDLFESFFYSQASLFITNEIIFKFLEACCKYLVPKCFVPIFALCAGVYKSGGPDQEFKSLQTIQYALIESDHQVSEQEIQDTLGIQKALIESGTNAPLKMSSFFNSLSTELADFTLTYIMKKKALNLHF